MILEKSTRDSLERARSPSKVREGGEGGGGGGAGGGAEIPELVSRRRDCGMKRMPRAKLRTHFVFVKKSTTYRKALSKDIELCIDINFMWRFVWMSNFVWKSGFVRTKLSFAWKSSFEWTSNFQFL